MPTMRSTMCGGTIVRLSSTRSTAPRPSSAPANRWMSTGVSVDTNVSTAKTVSGFILVARCVAPVSPVSSSTVHANVTSVADLRGIDLFAARAGAPSSRCGRPSNVPSRAGAPSGTNCLAHGRALLRRNAERAGLVRVRCRSTARSRSSRRLRLLRGRNRGRGASIGGHRPLAVCDEHRVGLVDRQVHPAAGADGRGAVIGDARRSRSPLRPCARRRPAASRRSECDESHCRARPPPALPTPAASRRCSPHRRLMPDTP